MKYKLLLLTSLFLISLTGIFEMDAINGDGKVIHVTEGRFDIGT